MSPTILRFFGTVGLFAALLAPSALRGEPLSVGDALPEAAAALPLVAGEDVAGENATGSLDALFGERGLLVIFTANTCAYAVDWRDRIPGLASTAAERSVGFALVNSNARKRKTDDSPTAMAEQAAEHFPGVAYWLDEGSRLADALGALRTPEVFLFDAERRLVYHGVIDDHSGPVENVTRHYLREALDALVGDGDMPEATAPLGCSVLRPRQRRRAGGP